MAECRWVTDSNSLPPSDAQLAMPLSTDLADAWRLSPRSGILLATTCQVLMNGRQNPVRSKMKNKKDKNDKNDKKSQKRKIDRSDDGCGLSSSSHGPSGCSNFRDAPTPHCHTGRGGSDSYGF